MTVEEFIKALEAKGIQLNDTQIKQFEDYFHLLVEWNEKVNLTAITEQGEVYLKHFYDSIMPLWMCPELFEGEVTLCDVGAGAGFPSIPLKIILPKMKVTIIDSLNKRLTFLKELTKALDLSDVTTSHQRAEDAGQHADYREQFDIVTARAVAQLNVLSEYCLPLTRKGGYFIAYKGQKAEEEVAQAEKAIALLGAKLEQQLTDTLPGEDSERELIIIRKTLNTPKKYPRQAGKPNKQPLV